MRCAVEIHRKEFLLTAGRHDWYLLVSCHSRRLQTAWSSLKPKTVNIWIYSFRVKNDRIRVIAITITSSRCSAHQSFVSSEGDDNVFLNHESMSNFLLYPIVIHSILLLPFRSVLIIRLLQDSLALWDEYLVSACLLWSIFLRKTDL